MKYTTENMFSRRWNAAYKSGTDQQQKCLNLINNLWCLFRDKLPNAIETATEVCGLDRNVFNKPSRMMLAFEVYPNEALLGVKDFFTVVVSPDGSMELDNLITGSTIKSSLSNQKEVISELRDIKNEFIRTYGRTEKFGESKKHTCSMQKKIESFKKNEDVDDDVEQMLADIQGVVNKYFRGGKNITIRLNCTPTQDWVELDNKGYTDRVPVGGTANAFIARDVINKIINKYYL